ncbi:hypothetical protein SSAmo_2060 [Enterobacterales bacterium endosymbiont of Anomoneura mori]|uniref:50S ribosomal protein L33 n=1 Tax=Enterobacterales bacterium endosymbiont of Anomoneura mori TaxID=3132096 RepID=UPI00399D178F
MKKKNIEKIKLISLNKNKHFYTTTKNKKNIKKIILKKYNPIVRKHILYKEYKI